MAKSRAISTKVNTAFDAWQHVKTLIPLCLLSSSSEHLLDCLKGEEEKCQRPVILGLNDTWQGIQRHS
jgi:hypothetical protein